MVKVALIARVQVRAEGVKWAEAAEERMAAVTSRGAAVVAGVRVESATDKMVAWSRMAVVMPEGLVAGVGREIVTTAAEAIALIGVAIMADSLLQSACAEAEGAKVALGVVVKEALRRRILAAGRLAGAAVAFGVVVKRATGGATVEVALMGQSTT
jgi:hypothetical protein